MQRSNFRRYLFVAVSALILAGCGSSESHEAEGPLETDPTVTMAGETWNEYDSRRDSYEGSRGSFGGNDCTEDCSGHEAGYEWARDKDITDPDDCGGKSWSFEEGCRSYAEEQSDSDDRDDEGSNDNED